jgi:hypothetical protein
VVAIASVAKYFVGDRVLVFAEELSKYGPNRSWVVFDAQVWKLDTLPGSDQLTGRLIVATSKIVHYQKTATRHGTREYRIADGKLRKLAVWPWDVSR